MKKKEGGKIKYQFICLFNYFFSLFGGKRSNNIRIEYMYMRKLLIKGMPENCFNAKINSSVNS